MSETKPAAGATSPRWYVVHTYSGYEAKVKASLDERRRGELAKKKADLATLEAKGDKDGGAIAELTRAIEQLESFRQVLVPAEKVVELVKGQRRTSTRKFFRATFWSTSTSSATSSRDSSSPRRA
jgi:transcriptional antiterminator NusG